MLHGLYSLFRLKNKNSFTDWYIFFTPFKIGLIVILILKINKKNIGRFNSFGQFVYLLIKWDLFYGLICDWYQWLESSFLQTQHFSLFGMGSK